MSEELRAASKAALQQFADRLGMVPSYEGADECFEVCWTTGGYSVCNFRVMCAGPSDYWVICTGGSVDTGGMNLGCGTLEEIHGVYTALRNLTGTKKYLTRPASSGE